MKKRTKYVIVPAVALLALLAAGGIAQARGFGGGYMMMGNADPATIAQRFDQKISQDAGLLGISVDEMKADWAQGKTIADIAKEKGISQADLKTKMRNAQIENMKQYLQTLVTQGKITQAQADSRLKFMTDKANNNNGFMGGRHGRGMMK